MNFVADELLKDYWGNDQVYVNIIMAANFLGAILLGMLLGVERTIRGRAAGLKTYGLVAGASCAIIIVSGYPHFWFGATTPDYFYPDPGRVIQGIVTGVGFLGAGVIMKDDFSITGLSTAASIWMCSAIGILVGIGFYFAAISLTLFSILLLSGISKMEKILPQQISYSIQLIFKKGFNPSDTEIFQDNLAAGLIIQKSSVNISYRGEQIIWKYKASVSNKRNLSSSQISDRFFSNQNIQSFDISKTRM